MSVILPFVNDPVIKTFSHYYFYFGILSGSKADINNFVFNNFIPLCFLKVKCFFGFPGVLSLFRLFERKKFPLNINNPVEFIKKNIDSGKYVQIYLNQSCISSIDLSDNFVHDFLYMDIMKKMNISM